MAQWQRTRLISVRFKVQVLVFRPINASFVSGEATGLQNRQDQFDSDTMLQHALVSQSEDYLATNESVAGSSPVGSTNIVL